MYLGLLSGICAENLLMLFLNSLLELFVRLIFIFPIYDTKRQPNSKKHP